MFTKVWFDSLDYHLMVIYLDYFQSKLPTRYGDHITIYVAIGVFRWKRLICGQLYIMGFQRDPIYDKSTMDLLTHIVQLLHFYLVNKFSHWMYSHFIWDMLLVNCDTFETCCQEMVYSMIIFYTYVWHKCKMRLNMMLSKHQNCLVWFEYYHIKLWYS